MPEAAPETTEVVCLGCRTIQSGVRKGKVISEKEVNRDGKFSKILCSGCKGIDFFRKK